MDEITIHAERIRNMENALIGLEIMGLGMAGIFAALIIIALFVYGLQKLDSISSKKEDKNNK